MPTLSPVIKRNPVGPTPKDREESEVKETKKKN